VASAIYHIANPAEAEPAQERVEPALGPGKVQVMAKA
jgi:hypothetical protein